MFDAILAIVIIIVMLVVLRTIFNWRMKLALNQSIKHEEKRVPSLSDEALQKRISQAEKIHGNKFLNGFIGLFFAKGYTAYKEQLMQLYRQEATKRGIL
ncbi:hypothetical protein IV487_11045 [Enterococcus saccharolyticus]|uniref:Uncharacterized protein n=1 Tax=Candidatus Enterococcus willemsii TaxID=1857215 RepID=A0ABQ6YXX5_9ENTE|nr:MULTISPECIES: hypothetical protein [Enterococcus]KAF1302539.1 hypothetical protein BAU17_02285 [Enterococcus sp. CU12B]MCD5002999.1 hypothetical protein [Enterococcus saccharolyticus]